MTSARRPHDVRVPRRIGHLVTPWIGAFVVVLMAYMAPGVASANEDTSAGGDEVPAESSVEDDLLRQGAAVYSSICASCHQPGGVGLSGRYPPLRDNPNLSDAAYISEVIVNGRQGEITVNGEIYDGVMPAQGSLSDADIEAVIAFIQSGFSAPAAAVTDVPASGPVAGTELPLLANYAWIGAFVMAALVLAVVLAPRVIAAHDRRELGWVDAWMKTAVIAVAGIVATTVVPAKVLESGTIQDLPRELQDLIAVSLWGGGIVVMIGALWYAHRQRRI